MNESLTIGSFLMISDDGVTYKILDDIVEYPDMGSSPESVDVTNLSDAQMRNIMGLQQMDVLEFPVGFRPDRFVIEKQLMASKATKHYALVFGGEEQADMTIVPTGSLGVLKWDGQLAARIAGAGVNAKRGGTISISVSSQMPFYANATAAGITIGDGYYTPSGTNSGGSTGTGN